MQRLLITLAVALLLAGCGPENNADASAQKAAAAKTAAALEQRAAQERQAETKLREQEARTSRWQFAAMLAVCAAAFALIIGTILGSRARHDAEK